MHFLKYTNTKQTSLKYASLLVLSHSIALYAGETSIQFAKYDNKGKIERVQLNDDGSADIFGWACALKHPGSVKVHLYLSAPANKKGIYISDSDANLPSGPEIAKACQSSGSNYRFKIALNPDLVQLHSKKKIYVHGMNPFGKANTVLTNSGRLTVPVPTKKPIDHSNLGTIDGVKYQDDGSANIIGWACAKNHSDSIKVHTYLGGAAGAGGEFFSENLANFPSEPAVAEACASTGTSYRFNIPLTAAEITQHVGKSIHLHGINPFGLANSAITNSGVFSITKKAKLSQVARSGQDLVIPSGYSVEIDTSVDIGKLTINGQLTCPETGEFSLKTSGILIAGKGSALNCGNSNHRFKGNLRIALKGGLYESIHGALSSDRNVIIMDGGTIQLVGDLKNTQWLRLAATANKGANQIELNQAVSWSAGDQIALAPTSYDFREAEQVTIDSVLNNGKIVRLKTPLKYSHWGELQTFQGRQSWSIDQRAEVTNLNRNIVIYSEGNPDGMDYRGAHLMVMRGAFAFVDAVEFAYMGRMGEMARYPFHWHRAGDVNGQYIKNSSIHHSFQRCLTIHGTNNAEVINNVCFDHFGHGFFLEDGDETGNKIFGNLGILSRRPPVGRHLLQSDIDVSNIDRFPGPATFWISHPKNYIKDNVAAGSEGTGFWNSFSYQLYCETWFCRKPIKGDKPNVFPLSENTLQFDGNIAHSAEVGLTWDGAPDGELTNNPNNAADRFLAMAHYQPPVQAQFNNLSIFKSRQAGIYFRGNTAYFNKSILADNKINYFFAYNQVVTDSVVVARTNNHLDSDFNFNREFTGIRIYDGPFDLRNVDFINFSDLKFNDQLIRPTPFMLFGGANRYTNVVQGIRFFPEPGRRVDFSPNYVYPWADWSDSTSLRDLDGSLTGQKNSIVVPDHPFNQDYSCTAWPGTSALRCSYEKGVFFFLSIRNNTAWENVPFLVKRSDGPSSHDNFDVFKSYPYNIKFGVILNKNYEYEVNFADSWSMPGKNSAGAWWPNSFQMIFQAEAKDGISPVVALKKLGQNCSIWSDGSNQWTKVSSLAQLRNQKANAYFSAGDLLYARFRATEAADVTPVGSEFAKPSISKRAMIQCE